jgi:ketosteroid isomerase-like protein
MAMNDPQLQGADRLREVFARVRKGDAAGVANLYAEDGKILFTGGEVQGRQAIQAFYQRTIETMHPQPQVEAVFHEAGRYVVVVNVPNDQGVTRAADLFDLSDGGIRQLEIFSNM